MAGATGLEPARPFALQAFAPALCGCFLLAAGPQTVFWTLQTHLLTRRPVPLLADFIASARATANADKSFMLNFGAAYTGSVDADGSAECFLSSTGYAKAKLKL